MLRPLGFLSAFGVTDQPPSVVPASRYSLRGAQREPAAHDTADARHSTQPMPATTVVTRGAVL